MRRYDGFAVAPESRPTSLGDEVDCNIRLGRKAIAALLLQRMLAIDSSDERACSLLSDLLDSMGAKGAAYRISLVDQEPNASWCTLLASGLATGSVAGDRGRQRLQHKPRHRCQGRSKPPAELPEPVSQPYSGAAPQLIYRRQRRI